MRVRWAVLGGVVALGWGVQGGAWASGHEHAEAKHDAHAEAHAPASASTHVAAPPMKADGVGGAVKKTASSIADTVVKITAPVREKIDRLRKLDEDNEKLRHRVAELEAERAELAHQASACGEGKRAHRIKEHAKKEGGKEHSRTIASLRAKRESVLSESPEKMFRYAEDAVALGDYESAAKALVTILDHPDNESFHTARTHFLLGFSLFKLGNYKRSLVHLKNSLDSARGADAVYGPKALAWIVLCHNRLGERDSERRAAHELMQRFPRSQEARRLNRDV